MIGSKVTAMLSGGPHMGGFCLLNNYRSGIHGRNTIQVEITAELLFKWISQQNTISYISYIDR